MSDFNAKPFGDRLKKNSYSSLAALFLVRGCRPVNKISISMTIGRNCAIFVTVLLFFYVPVCRAICDDAVRLVVVGDAISVAVTVRAVGLDAAIVRIAIQSCCFCFSGPVSMFVEIGKQEPEKNGMESNPPHKSVWVIAFSEQ